VLLLPALLLPFLGASAAVGGTLIASPAELAVLPTSGGAWTYLKGVADGPLGTADLTDQDDKHAVRTLAVALVGNRLGSDAYRSRAHAAIMSAVGTERVGADNSILALGRQLGAYVLAADLIGLSGPDDATFRSWLSAIRTRELGGTAIQEPEGNVRGLAAQLGELRLRQPHRREPVPRRQRRDRPKLGGLPWPDRRPRRERRVPGPLLRRVGVPGQGLHAGERSLSRRPRPLRRVRQGRHARR
jgi:hypothetical protein